MIEKINAKELGFAELCVVDADGLRATTRGWSLIAMLHEQKIEMIAEPMPETKDTYGNSMPRTWMKPYVISVTRYLIGRPEAAVLADMDDKIRGLTGERDDLATAKFNLTKEAKEVKDQLAKVEGLAGRRYQALRDAEELSTRTAESNRKLERDIAKIRAAVGELKMKEILEENA